jgi:hypothetical protein
MAKGISSNNLCALCLLFVHTLVFIREGPKDKEEAKPIEGFVFFVFTKKKLSDLCVLCGWFFIPPRRAQRFL